MQIQVKQVKNISGQVCLAPIKDIKLTEGPLTVTLKKDVPCYSVPGCILDTMTRPYSLEVYLKRGLLFINPIIRK